VCLTANNNYGWQRRTTAGGTTSSTSGGAGNVAPNNWVRLVRTGNSCTAYKSANGTTWTQIGASVNISMGTVPFMGFAVTSGTSGTNAVLNTSVFDNITAVP